jgi:hypothetical protein
MTFTALIIVNVLLDIALIGGIAHTMSHPRRLRPHGQGETTTNAVPLWQVTAGVPDQRIAVSAQPGGQSTPTALSEATQAP